MSCRDEVSPPSDEAFLECTDRILMKYLYSVTSSGRCSEGDGKCLKVSQQCGAVFFKK